MRHLGWAAIFLVLGMLCTVCGTVNMNEGHYVVGGIQWIVGLIDFVFFWDHVGDYYAENHR